MQFADFIAPFDPEQFRREYYGRRPLYLPGAGRATLDILNWARFNAVLALTPYWNEETLKVFYKSRAALRENYCDVAAAPPGGYAPVNPAKVKALLGLGASLVANHLHRVCPEVARVVAVLEREFAARAFANVYCSFRGVQAFQTHFDLHDVFAYQAEGEKTWRVYAARAEAPVAPLPPGDETEKWLIASRGRLLLEVVMKPGDILYLPRGQYHDALTGDRASLHVTFGVAPATGLALFKVLENIFARERLFREYLPDARAQSALSAHLAALAARVQAVMTSPAFVTDVRNLQRDLARPRADYSLPEQVTPMWFSVLKRAQVLRRDDGYVVACDGQEIPLGTSYPTIEWLLQQRLFSLDDALARQTGLDPNELAADLERLAAAGIVARTEMR
ncbi:MAG: cupin domain-containing protein [Steroidobacteraceae bacterium]|nr:cupin domain-containing protein [Steroidobacteraceae bacterium]MDW8260815.1 cupin domain-containing protein [Gammaproteobacteria bacterium]